MVGSLLLMKILHCRNKEFKSRKHILKNEKNSNVEGTSQDEKPVKREVKIDEICRICLKEGKLPIFGDNVSKELCESIVEIAAIDVFAEDPYPKFLCHSCNALLQGAILFRKTAQKSNKSLKNRFWKSKQPEPISETDEPGGSHSDDNDIESDTTKQTVKWSKLQLYPDGDEQKEKCPAVRTCNRCDLKFNSFLEYSEHRLSSEHENKRVTCTICKNSYSHQYFKRHMLLRHKENVTSHICDVCGKKFTLQSIFARHRLTHFYDLPFQCTVCPYRGRFTESLKMHMRSHTGEKPYQCEQCPSRFISKSNLNKHTLTHKSDYDFRCEVCGKGFYTKRDLELHIKVDHTGIREHVCKICGKAFGYRKQMMKHSLIVHKREKLKSGRMPIYLKVETMKQQHVEGPKEIQ